MVNTIDNKANRCYYVYMINKITNKYYTYTPNEFLPIYTEGKISNKNEFHAYKAKCALKRIGKALAPTAHRIDDYFVNH